MSQLIEDEQEVDSSPVLAGLQASLVAGTAGLVVGGTIGIAKSKVPLVLWTVVSSLQWALLGGTYWGLRTSLIQQVPAHERIDSAKLAVSSLSGGLSFALVGAVTRGRQNVIPGTVMGSFLGFAGQGVYNVLDRKHTVAVTQSTPSKTIWERLTTSKWSPITKLSDDDYLKLLNEKRLKLDAEIAVLDDEINELEQQEQLQAQISELRKQNGSTQTGYSSG